MTINTKGNLIDLKTPKVMGILNLTEDSFYDGGLNSNLDQVLQKVDQMVNCGAKFIDIGGQSSRPNAKLITAEEELKIVFPKLNKILEEFPDIIFSIDTFWSKVAKEAVDAGVAIINDVSAGSIDPLMFSIVADLQVPYILMHMQGTPETMQKSPYYEDVLLDVNQFFSEKLSELKRMGVNDIILDPGYGFGKTNEHNYELLKNQSLIGFGNHPILAGVSRKSMVTKVLNISNKEALNGTSAVHMLALMNNAKLLRVHDVKEAIECIKIYEAYRSVNA